MASKDATREERVTAASYIISFYKEVSDLTHNFANYSNVLTQLGEKANNFVALSDSEKNVLIEAVQLVRFYAHKTYIQYACIKTSLKKDDAKPVEEKPEQDEIEKLYGKLKDNFIIKREDLEKYVIALNAFLIRDIMKDLLKTSNAIVDDIVGKM